MASRRSLLSISTLQALWFAVAMTSCLAVVACSAPSSSPVPQSSTASGPAAPVVLALWPHISGRVGSYDARTTQNLTDMAADGLSMLVGGTVSESARVEAGISYIDGYPWGLILAYGCPDFFARKSPSCQISDSTSVWMLSQLQAHLDTQRSDSNVIAYWLLDDYPGGNISTVLQKMHDLIAASNDDPASSFPRPALCGFGGQILPLSDKHPTPTDPHMSYFAKSLTNFSTSYCDMVALYPYASNSGSSLSDPSRFDWSMKFLLPEMFKELQDRGWDSSTEPLIGMPQTFGYATYVGPTQAEIVTQMTSYCNAGAVALLIYSWDDGYPSAFPDSPSREPVNSPDMRAGIGQGVKQCQTDWSNN